MSDWRRLRFDRIYRALLRYKNNFLALTVEQEGSSVCKIMQAEHLLIQPRSQAFPVKVPPSSEKPWERGYF